MTDQEKMIELLKAIGEKASEEHQTQLIQSAKFHADWITAYMRAGFTRKEAINVTTQIIVGFLATGKLK